MKLEKIIPAIALTATIAACGSDFEWFPAVEDTTAPKVSATIAGRTFSNSTTALVSNANWPATLSFTANEAATIFYSTNGSDPSVAVDIPSAFASSSVPDITVSDTVLKFFGQDKSTRKNQSSTITIKIQKLP